MSSPIGYLSPAVAGSGAIAVGIAASATALGQVHLLARSDSSAWRAEEEVEQICATVDGADASRLRVSTEISALSGCDLVIEAIAEDAEAKVELHGSLLEACPDADLATTTSALGIADLGSRIGAAERFYGLHVFNPVHRMDLVELCLPPRLAEGVRDRARAFCAALGKTVVEVPDQPGFVVNRLLFPYLFDAVRLIEDSGLSAGDVDACMSLGAGHPMGPLKLLDFIGIDVAIAIGESLYADSANEAHAPPALLGKLVAQQKLGRKSGEGFFSY